MRWVCLSLLLLLCGCNLPSYKTKPEAAAAPVIPVGEPVSVNLNFVGLKGQPDNTADFMGRFDPDEFKYFPIRYPVNNLAMYTKVKPTDTMQFAFVSLWGEYKGELYGLQVKPSEKMAAAVEMRDYQLNITPKLLRPDKGMYRVVLKHKDGTVIATMDINEKGDYAEPKPASSKYRVKRVFRDTLLRISGFEIWEADAKREDLPLLGLQIIAEGWGDSRWQQGLLPPWSKYKRVFPEVDLQVLPHEWFYGKTIQQSCMELKASAWDQGGKRLGMPGDNRDGNRSFNAANGVSVGLGGAVPRCYG